MPPLSLGTVRAVTVCAAVMTPLVALAGQVWRLGPDHYSVSHPLYPSIEVLEDTTGRAGRPHFSFYSAPDLQGAPVWLLDAAGLHIDGVLRCRWWDGHLGLIPRPEGTSLRDPEPGCPAGLPVATKMTDGGLAGPALFIAVRALQGHVAEIQHGRRSFYFDIKTIPGDPRPEEAPPVPLPKKGDIGWRWIESQREIDRREGEMLARRLTEPSFATFYHGIRACFMGRQPSCLTPYLDDSFMFRPWWNSERDIPRRSFARFAWQSGSDDSYSLWQDLAWMFLRGRVYEDGDGLWFYRKFLRCQVVRRSDGYRVASCDAVE